jgi:REP element-mobilizing transposase RayT
MERYGFHSDRSVYFVTFSIVDWLPVFIAEASMRIVTDSLNYCHKNKGLRTNAYVIMPTHMHAILFHQTLDGAELERVLIDFRKFTGRNLCDYSDKHFPACFAETFRAAAGKDRERRFWQPSRHPEVIETESFWNTKIDYLHANPCRKGLVVRAADWRFSSASFWQSEGKFANDVVLSPIPW